MKKTAILLVLALSVALSACGKCEKKEQKEKGMAALELPEYVESLKDIDAFAAQASEPTAAQMDGIAISPLYQVEINGLEVPAYCVPVTVGGPHSFAMLDASADEFPMEVTVTAADSVSSAVVLPERRGITPSVSGKRIKFTINGYGDYTVITNDSYVRPITVIVRKIETPSVPNGYTLIEYQKGIHFVESISLESNTVLYLHAGALLIAKQPTVAEEMPTQATDWAGMTRWRSLITAEYKNNITIAGHGVIDFTNLTWHARSPISIVGCDNVKISGITLINAPEWNITVTLSKHIDIRDVVIFGYRQNSDGIAMVDSSNALIEDCFIRSGDDLFEVKSNYLDSETGGRDITYRNCTAWADKCRGFGVIQETKNDMQDLTWEGCSMLYAMQDWSEELGSIVVIVGDGGHISQVNFRDIEVWYSKSYAINVSLGPTDWSEGSTVGEIDGVTFENIRLRGNNRIRVRGTGAAPDNIVFSNIIVDGNRATALSDFDMTYIGTHGNITVK